MAFRALEKLMNLHDGYRSVFRIDGLELLLLVEAGKTFLLLNSCPHLGKSLYAAAVSADGKVLRCPHHGLEFDLYSGRNVNNNSQSCAPLKLYKFAYQGNLIGVDL